ncbi:hypothetical protein MPSEU_000932100 [Mayamaea pseudoterrestris]|nr:hypothetical protein MPSEU_000932100 [Mayamaea pseudoterrestris]
MSVSSSLPPQWLPTDQLQQELLEMDPDFATPQPLSEIVLQGRLQDSFLDWNDFTDRCLASLTEKPIVWTGPHVFLTTAMGISDLVDSWHDAIAHIYVSRCAASEHMTINGNDEQQGGDDTNVYSLYTTFEEHPMRTLDGICKLLSHCQPPLNSVQVSMLMHPLSTLSLSRLASGNIRKIEITTPKGVWSGRECQALASASDPRCQLEIMVDSLTDSASKTLATVLASNAGPSRLRLGTIEWDAFLRLTQPLADPGTTRLQSLTVLEVTNVHLAVLAVSLATNAGLEELAIVGTFGSKETDTSFQALMQAVATHSSMTSLTLNLHLAPNTSERRVAELSQAIQDMIVQSKSLTHVSLPLDYAFLECISIDVDRYIKYNQHRPRAAALRASSYHQKLLSTTLAAVNDINELVYLFLRQAVEYL